MLFYDIEAFPQYWCVVVVDDETSTRYVFEDVPALRDYYKENRHQTWIGYNSRQYDAVMIRYIMLGCDPYEVSQALIEMGRKWFQFDKVLVDMYKRIPLRNYDAILPNKGLKKLQGFRGSSIVESSIPWDYEGIFTREMKDQTIYYCTHDVLELRKIFNDTREEYEAHEALITAFEIDPIHFSKTKAQLVGLILGARQQQRFDEWDFEIVDTIVIEKYKEVVDWYLNPANHNYKAELIIDIAGVPHKFKWGGIHGAREKYGGKGYYLNMDVGSYYPALMIEYGFLSRNVPQPQKFKQIRDDRLVLKKNKDPKQLPYKISINATFGASKDKYNALYDPRQANNICINGQLMLLDLIEKLEPYCDLIQSNTDGILVKLRAENDAEADEQQKFIEGITEEWQTRVRMSLEFDRFKAVYQKDVNNYLIVPDGDLYYESGMPAWKAKGSWAKEWYKEVKIDGKKTVVQDYTEYDCVILREALHNYYVLGIPVEDTINNCDELRKFQKLVMVSAKYDYAIHGTPTVHKYRDEANKPKEKLVENESCKILKEKHLRIFASIDPNDGMVYKKHAKTKSLGKVTDCPKHVFICNENIEKATASDFPLDKSYYIKMANSRVQRFAIIE